MARHEDETEEIVADVLVDRRVGVLDLLIAFSVASELFVLALERLAAPDQVSGAVLRGSHQRSEEHTSELQSPCNLVCRLLLEKKKKNLHAARHRCAPIPLPSSTTPTASRPPNTPARVPHVPGSTTISQTRRRNRSHDSTPVSP